LLAGNFHVASITFIILFLDWPKTETNIFWIDHLILAFHIFLSGIHKLKHAEQNPERVWSPEDFYYL